MRIHYLPTVLLLATAALLLLVALALVLKGRAVRRAAAGFRRRAVTTTATVVGLEAKDLGLGAEPDTRYFPRVSYVPDGATGSIEAQTLTDVPAPPPHVGAEIAIAYDPDHHDRVDVLATEGRAEGAGRTWFVLAAYTALAATGIAAAWLVLVVVVWTS